MDKETKRKVKITILGILGILMLLIGVTFAAFSSDLAGVQIQGMQTGCLKVEMTDNGSVQMTNEAPVTDEVGLSKKAYTYTLTNSCTTDAFYTATINVLNTSNLDNISKIKVALDGDSYLAPTIESNLEEMENVDPSETGISKTYKLDEGYLKVGESKTFNLRTWIDYDVTSITGGLENKVIVLSEAKDGLTIDYDTNTAAYDVLKGNDVLTNVNYNDIAPSTNQITGIVKVEKEEGAKYYFRGNPNNNITFAGKNFKVLSTNEDGSVNIVTEEPVTTGTYANIESLLNTYYTNNLKQEEQYIDTTSTFCMETKDSSNNYLGSIKIENKNPTGECETGNYLTKIGTINGDDMMYAGGKINTANTSFYLKSSSNYYIGTEKNQTESYAYTQASSITNIAKTTSQGIKAVITLKETSMIKGKGTTAEPFYISGVYGEEQIDTSDKTAPEIVLARADEKWSKENKQIEIVAKDNTNGSGIGGYLVKTNSTKPAATDSNWEATSSTTYNTVKTYDNGTYYVFVKDNSGNVSEGKKVVIDKVDKTAPTCTIRINPNGTAAAYKTLTITSEETNIDLNGYSWDNTDSKKDVVKVTEKKFQKEVYDCHGAVLVEFYASWCPKCAMMEDVLV